jgi:hypothetical protein
LPLWVLPPIFLAIQACAPSEPFYDDAIGLEGVATEAGALSGTFGQKVFAATLVQVPLFADELGGGFQWLLVERSWDSEADAYRQKSRICDGKNLEVHGTVADVPRSTYRAVTPSEGETLLVDHASGEAQSKGLVQLWGIRNLKDPANDPFPENIEEAEANGFLEKTYDLDEDDAPGYTTFVEGLANGTAQGVLRRKTDTRGVVLGPDRILGLAETQYDSLFLGADDDLVERMMQGDAPPYPDPRESWFEELRLSPGADCDDVVALEKSGVFSRLRPF